MIDLHGGIFNMAQKATGDIRRIQIWSSLSTLSIFPLSYIALKCGLSPEVVYLICILISCFNVSIILFFVCKKLSFSLRDIITASYLKMEAVTLLSLPLPILFHFLLEGWPRLIIVTATSIICITTLVWGIGCTKAERVSLMDQLKKSINRKIQNC